MFRQGRIPVIDKSVVINILVKYKHKILLKGDKILSKRDIVWQQISHELNNKKSARSLYTFVCSNTYGIRDTINDRLTVVNSNGQENQSINSSMNSTLNSNDFEGLQTVTLSWSRHSFDSIVTEKMYKGRPVKKLKSGVWQREVSERLWNATKLKCGFNFKYHHINNEVTSGSIKGKCDCGTNLKIMLQISELVVKFHCEIFLKKGTCGKRQLRQPYRRQIAKSLFQKSAELYRVECANTFMEPGDPEPPFLPKSSTLNTAKYEYVDSLCLDKDPIISIAKMKRVGETNEKQTIRQIGYDPFYVFYWTNQQSLIYKKYADSGFSSLSIDASGSLVSKILRSDGTLSQHIFLYIGVIHYGSGQTSVVQMLSEAHDTANIQNWLTQWLRSGVLPPSEAVCDSSRALLTAIVRTFTGLQTIEKYCDQFLLNNLPPCFIRIDVNHFIKIYANVLKSEHRLIKKFYLGVMGRIVLSLELSTARDLIKSALIVSQSETEGQSSTSNTEVPCNHHKQNLLNIITGHSFPPEVDVDMNAEDLGVEMTAEPDLVDIEHNIWDKWAQDVQNEIQSHLKTGISPNAHYCPNFSKQLLKDLKHLPMWSCCYRNKFGFGRIPCTSAAVEGEFNKIKHVIFGNEKGKLRADRFIEKHVKVLSGQTNLVQARLTEEDVANNKSAELFEPSQSIDLSIPAPTETIALSTPAPTQDEQRTCIVCENGDEPSGAHTCITCSKHVHMIEGCSLSIQDENEGYGERRICVKCHTSNAATYILPTRFQENWRGQVTGSKRQKSRPSLYLGNEDHLRQSFNFPKNTKFPILKNGSLGIGQYTSKDPISKKNITFTAINTCAFDSILQILVSTFADNMQTDILEGQGNPLMELGMHIAKNGLKGPMAYQTRTRLLCQYFEQEEVRFKKTNNCKVLDCAIGITSAILHSFREHPSCTEVSTCETSCTNILKKRNVLNLSFDELRNPDFDEVITEKLFLETRQCMKCNTPISTKTTSIGTFMFFEVTDADLHSKIAINTLPTSYTIILNDSRKSFRIAGVVDFKAPYSPLLRRTKDNEEQVATHINALGHYTAICPRPCGRWTEYDDLSEKEKSRTGIFQCCPALIMYKQINDN